MRRPKEWHGLEPKIENQNQLDAALWERGVIKAESDRVKAACKIDVDRIKKDADAQLVWTIEGEKVAFKDRDKALEAEILRYSNEQREALLADGKKKTVEFSHGKIAWRAQSQHVEFDADEAETLKTIEDQAELENGFIGRIVASLRRVKVSEQLTAADILHVQVSIDKEAVLAAHKKKQITDAELKKLGMSVETPDEKCSATPHKCTLESASQAP